ncbi:MAG: succinate dehydrogenase [Actinobacteria bacterium]|nr:succinate dehydrogenase [Actinomycetota bacterium]
MKTQRTDWGRRQPPLSGSSFELYAWFFMRVSGLLLVLLAVGHMFIMHVFNDTLNLDYEFVAARWDTPYWRAFDWLLLALSLLHGTNGLRVVLHDNISDQTVRKLSLSALYVTSTVFFILGTYVIVAFVSKL